jgi:high-affinity nickel-transport protein
VVVLALAVAATAPSQGSADSFHRIGGVISALVAMMFLLLVASLNAVVLRGVVRLWRLVRRGEVETRSRRTCSC